MRNNGGFIGSVPTTTSGTSGVANGVWSLQATHNRRQRDIWPDTAVLVTDPVYSTVLLRLPFDSNLTDVSNSPISANDQSSGKSFVSGKFGNSLNVNQGYINYPTGNYVAATGSSHAATTHTATLEFWLKSTASTYGSSDVVLLDLGTSGSTNLYIVGNGNEVRYRYGTSGGTPFHTYTQNTWHHYLIQWYFLFSLTSTFHFWQWELFVDGGKVSHSPQNVTEVPSKFSIGAGAGVNSSFYLDDVRITSGNTRIGGVSPSTYTVPTAAYPTS